MKKELTINDVCIRGGEDIASRIIKAFEKCGVSNDTYKLFGDGFTYYYFANNDGCIDYMTYPITLTEVTIEELEAITDKHSKKQTQKVFPRMMLVSDDKEYWEEGLVVADLSEFDLNYPIIVKGKKYIYPFKYAKEITSLEKWLITESELLSKRYNCKIVVKKED